MRTGAGVIEATPGVRVADAALASAGRREISLAEHEMPGLMKLRETQGPLRPLAGARISGFLHMTAQTAVLIETLVALGAQVRWAGSDPLSTQDSAAAAVAAGPHGDDGIPVFARKGQDHREFWQSARHALSWPDGGLPDLFLEDGAGLVTLVHWGLRYEKDGEFPAAESGLPEPAVAAVTEVLEAEAGRWHDIATRLKGATEQTTTGARHLRKLAADGELRFPVISVNDAVTKSKFDNRYGCRHSVVDALNRATDVLLGGKLAVVCGFGDVGKGCAEALRGQGARVVVTEVDPICALQAVMSGYPVVTLDEVADRADVVITTTGLPDVVTIDHLARMKHLAIVGNMAHDATEIDLAGLRAAEHVRRVPVKPQVDEWAFDDGHSVIVLSDGHLMNLGNATGHPSFVMSTSFTNQVLAQIELFGGSDRYPVDVHTLPPVLDEQVARLHLAAVDARLTVLTEHQARVLGVAVEGPYKPAHYRY
ncbi:adenosylhomocysteinase [Amycolatopsis sp. PS_44_ISF1]|uniref:adenosylhomocysteinase n=1 Tax=Amycolatopsis sp. PS_44_ISF1 TaxID=2974917 RepID=UPI0037C0E72E